MFLSSHESGVDAKKRISIPSGFRKVLGAEDSVFLWPSLDKPCLEGGGAVLVRKFQRAIGRLKPLDPRREALSYAIFGLGRPYKFDESGRIVLETDMMAHATILDRARFVGLGDRFQIWSPDIHQPRSTDLRQLAHEAMDLLDPFEDDGEVPATP